MLKMGKYVVVGAGSQLGRRETSAFFSWQGASLWRNSMKPESSPPFPF